MELMKTTMENVKIGQVFSWGLADNFQAFKLIEMYDMSDDILFVHCKATENSYKYGRYEVFKGKIQKELTTYIVK